MKLSSSFLVAAQLLSVLALPAPNRAREVARASAATTAEAASTTAAAEEAATTTAAETASTTAAEEAASSTTAAETASTAETAGEAATTTAAETATATTTEAAATTTAAAGEGEANEVEQQVQFGQVVELGGGNVKTDLLFPAGTNGVFEVEFQNQEGRQIRVSENTNPAAAPAGFVAVEPVSYIVELGGGAAAAQGLTLQRIDYILNANSTVDINTFATGQVARFCTEANAFVFGEGELEFEAEERELTLTVSNMVGEWAVFVPQAGAEAGAGAGAEAGAGAGAGEGAAAGETGAGAGAADTCGQGSMCRALLDALERLTGGGAAAAPAAR